MKTRNVLLLLAVTLLLAMVSSHPGPEKDEPVVDKVEMFVCPLCGDLHPVERQGDYLIFKCDCGFEDVAYMPQATFRDDPPAGLDPDVECTDWEYYGDYACQWCSKDGGPWVYTCVEI